MNDTWPAAEASGTQAAAEPRLALAEHGAEPIGGRVYVSGDDLIPADVAARLIERVRERGARA